MITLCGLAGMCAACWFIGIPIVGHDYVVCGLPPLTGGLVATNMMQTAAMEKGLTFPWKMEIALVRTID